MTLKFADISKQQFTDILLNQKLSVTQKISMGRKLTTIKLTIDGVLVASKSITSSGVKTNMVNVCLI